MPEADNGLRNAIFIDLEGVLRERIDGAAGAINH